MYFRKYTVQRNKVHNVTIFPTSVTNWHYSSNVNYHAKWLDQLGQSQIELDKYTVLIYNFYKSTQRRGWHNRVIFVQL